MRLLPLQLHGLYTLSRSSNYLFEEDEKHHAKENEKGGDTLFN